MFIITYLDDVGYISTVAALITFGATQHSIRPMKAIICKMGISVNIQNKPHVPGTIKDTTIKKS